MIMEENLEKLKDIWNKAKIDNDLLQQTNRELSEKLATAKAGTLQDTFARRIRNISFICFLLPVLAPTLYFILPFPLWVSIIYSLYGIVCFVIGYKLYRYINACSLATMPVIQAVTRAAKIRIYYIRVRIVCLLLGLPIIVMLMVLFYDMGEVSIMIGAIIGLVVGLILGVSRLLKDLSYTRRILAALSEFAE